MIDVGRPAHYGRQPYTDTIPRQINYTGKQAEYEPESKGLCSVLPWFLLQFLLVFLL